MGFAGRIKYFLHIYLLIISIPTLFKQVPEQSRAQMLSHALMQGHLTGTNDSPSSSQSSSEGKATFLSELNGALSHHLW